MKTFTFKAIFIAVILITLNSSCSHCDDDDNKKYEKVQASIAKDSIMVQELD